MRQYIYLLFALLTVIAPIQTSAQRSLVTDFAPFEMRKEAEQQDRVLREYYKDFTPKPIYASDSMMVAREILQLPDKWSDRVVTLHAENIFSAYDIVINDELVISYEDGFTPHNIEINNYLTQGINRIDMILRDSRCPELDGLLSDPSRARFVGSYLSAQPKNHINDFRVKLTPDPTNQFATLDIEILLRNDFVEAESVDVGFDIYDPNGKLLEFSVNEFNVEGGVTDTVRFNPLIYGVNNYKWSPKSPSQYKVMLYTRRNGMVTEYIPLSISFLDLKYEDGQITNFGQPLDLKIERYTPSLDAKSCRTELVTLKKRGVNTLSPLYPQPRWFYELCEELGFWVIDQVNINATQSADNKKVGGTPSNNPALLDEYLSRGASCYYRSRGFGSVVAYSLGGDESGNGYNMYRLYEWIKSVESDRPIIYIGAQGEWNSDILK